MSEYKGTETFRLLIKNREAHSIVEEWTERNVQTDLRLRRAKTRGHVVIETKDVIFASFVQKNWPSCQVDIKE